MSIPTPRGKQIKTDRIDAAQLAQFSANNLLTVLSIPEPNQEHDRDLLRTRQHLVEPHTALRKHLQAVLRSNRLHDKAQLTAAPLRPFITRGGWSGPSAPIPEV